MLVVIPVFTCLLFGLIYPLFFWSTPGVFVRRDYTQFSLGMVSVVASLGVFILFFLNIDQFSKILAAVWALTLLGVTGLFWQKGKINEWIVSLPSILGAWVLFEIYPQFFPSPDTGYILGFLAALIGGGVLCGSVFNTVFGHWYLISSKFPIIHLFKSTAVFFGVVLVRLIWDAVFLWKGHLTYGGDPTSFYEFLFTLDGIFLFIGFLFGVLFPLGSMFLVWGTLKVQSTTSATGLLYVILISVLIGDLTFKYYLLRYNIYL